LGDWTLYCGSTPLPVHLTDRDNTAVPRDRQATSDGLKGEGVTALVNKQDRRKVELTISSPEAGRAPIRFEGLLLSRERGIVAGTANGGKRPGKSQFGAVLVRRSDSARVIAGR
jgi:hypothetical protein